MYEPEEALGAFIASPNRVALLVGAPGAGKTYSIRRYVASQAAAILADADASPLDIPLHLDMKLYRGSLWQMAEEHLPAGLTLERLMESHHMKFFIDAVNEMAQEYIDDGRFHADLADFMRRASGAGIIATSRSEQGMTAFGSAVYDLDALDYEFVEEYLDREDIQVARQWQREIVDLLRKPLFFRLFAEHTELFRNLATPNAFYERLFLRINERVQQRTGVVINVVAVLGEPGFNALERANELIPAKSIIAAIEAALRRRRQRIRREEAAGVFDALLSEGILTPHAHAQTALFHQSATEFLAAPRLARVIAHDPVEARRLLARTHWDHSFLLALERVPRRVRRGVFTSLMQLDRSFAARAVRYMGSESSWAAVQFLGELDTSDLYSEDAMNFSWVVRDFPATPATRDALLTTVAGGGLLGGAAVVALCAHKLSRTSRAHLMQLVVEHVADFNFGASAAPALAKQLTIQELKATFRRLKDVPLELLDYEAFTNTCGALLHHLSLAEALAVLEQWNVSARIREGVVAEVLFNRKDDEMEAVVREAFRRIVNGAWESIFPGYIVIRRDVDRHLLESLVTRELIENLISRLHEQETGRWGAELLCLIGTVATAQLHLARAAGEHKGLKRAILLLASGETRQDEFWQELDLLSSNGIDQGENLEMLRVLANAHWTGHLDILFKLFETQRLDVAGELLQFMQREKSDRFAPLFEAGKLDWWLSWFESSATEWQQELLGQVIATGGSSLHRAVLDRFNAQRFRPLLAQYVLPRLREGTTDDLNADSVSWLINHSDSPPSFTQMSALGSMATEQFVTTVLLSQFKRARGKRRRAGLLRAIREAGERHRRRYVDERGQLL